MVYIKALEISKHKDLLGGFALSIFWFLLVIIILGGTVKAQPLIDGSSKVTKQTQTDVKKPVSANNSTEPLPNSTTQTMPDATTQSSANATTEPPADTTQSVVNSTTETPTNSTTQTNSSTQTPANATKQASDSAANSDRSLWKGKTVLLDAGHGGHDPGAVRLGIREKDITLQIVLHLRKVLKARGAKVIVTREDDKVDLELSDISAIVTKVNPDIFISIHVNSSVAQSSSGGLQTYFREACSRMLAHTMHSILLQQLKATDKGIFTRNFWVLNNPNVPSLLIETGYITNRPDRRNLITPSYQHKFCVAIANGLELYWAKKKLGLKN